MYARFDYKKSKREHTLRISELEARNIELLQLLEASQRELLTRHKVSE